MKELWLNQIKLTNFKNYASASIKLDKKLNCFVGNNGMGKTNLLDAVYYLCTGKSNFRSADKIITKKESPFFRLEGTFQLASVREKIVAKVIPNKKKELIRNDIPYKKLSEHIGLLPIVFICSDDISLIREGSEERRRFINNILAQTDREYLRAIIQYQTVLKQRNALLKSLSDQYGVPSDTLLDVYTEQLIGPGIFIHARRTAFTRELLPIIRNNYGKISQDAEIVGSTYQSQLTDQDFRSLLKENLRRDQILQRTTVGVHKDDWKFSIEEAPFKKFGSQGQLKSFAIALKLTEYHFLQQELQKKPLLILDDIFDKLDQSRVDQLLSLVISGDFGQILISDTHADRVQSLTETKYQNGIFFQIENGSASLL